MQFVIDDPEIESDLRIYDIAILTAQLGDEAYLSVGKSNKITAGDLQLVAYFTNGRYIAKTGASLFKEDFYFKDGLIENPEIKELFGNYDNLVGEVTDTMKSYLRPLLEGFTPENNMFVKSVIKEIIPKDNAELLKELANTGPCINALSNENHIIRKYDMRDYFESDFRYSTGII